CRLSTQPWPRLVGSPPANVIVRPRSVVPMPTADTGKPRARRGFAAMNPERRREIARKGGASVPGEKRSCAKDRDLAASAGRKGGEATRGGGRTPHRGGPGLGFASKE